MQILIINFLKISITVKLGTDMFSQTSTNTHRYRYSPSAEADSPSRPQYIVHPKQYILTPLWII